MTVMSKARTRNSGWRDPLFEGPAYVSPARPPRLLGGDDNDSVEAPHAVNGGVGALEHLDRFDGVRVDPAQRATWTGLKRHVIEYVERRVIARERHGPAYLNRDRAVVRARDAYSRDLFLKHFLDRLVRIALEILGHHNLVPR